MLIQPLTDSVHFPTVGEMLLGAASGVIASLLLIYWLGDQIDRYLHAGKGIIKIKTIFDNIKRGLT
jgi:hypothetical protein